MTRPLIAIGIFLLMLTGIPYFWPEGFSEPPLLMVLLLTTAAVAALVIGRRRRERGWGTSSST
jgi:hypothetical protein